MPLYTNLNEIHSELYRDEYQRSGRGGGEDSGINNNIKADNLENS